MPGRCHRYARHPLHRRAPPRSARHPHHTHETISARSPICGRNCNCDLRDALHGGAGAGLRGRTRPRDDRELGGGSGEADGSPTGTKRRRHPPGTILNTDGRSTPRPPGDRPTPSGDEWRWLMTRDPTNVFVPAAQGHAAHHASRLIVLYRPPHRGHRLRLERRQARNRGGSSARDAGAPSRWWALHARRMGRRRATGYPKLRRRIRA